MELICPAVLRGCGLHKNSAVLAAFSGGADSTALVLELARLSRQGELGVIYAAHYHHGIRGEEAERDLAFCRALCQRLGIPILFERGDVPAAVREKGISVESAARELRYGFLRRAAARTGAEAVALGHHREDQAETVLMHLIRGSGLRGLGGMAPKSGLYVRPLLEAGKEDILAYLAERGESFCTDSTNAGDEADRNRLRHGAMEALKAVNPQAAAHMAHTAALVREEDGYLETLAEEAEKNCRGSRRALEALPPVLGRRVLLRILRTHTSDYTREDVRRLEGLLSGPGGRMAPLTGGWTARAEGDAIRLYAPGTLEAEAYVLPLEVGKKTETPFGSLLLERVSKACIPCGPGEAYVDEETLQGPLLVRPWRRGERFTPLGMKGSKLFSDYFTDKKVPLSLRQTPVVFDAIGAVYAAGHTIDDRVRITAATRQILHFQFDSIREV